MGVGIMAQRLKKITLVSKKIEIRFAKAVPLEAGKSYMIIVPDLDEHSIDTLQKELKKRGINDAIIINADATNIVEVPLKGSIGINHE
jgi:16S rRNA C967 or C1407 C5-methylase (RsmB/RsmF family)